MSVPDTPDTANATDETSGTSAVAAAAIRLLSDRGARDLAHPGGTLLAHLRRVHELLAEWRARPAVRIAGLCHAFYGTDGFATALGEVTRRDELAAITGEEAERLVYLYASCDRERTYPRLLDGWFTDRFTGAEFQPHPRACRDFAELTVANELDVMRANADLRARYGPGLHELFTSWRPLLSPAALRAVRTMW